MTVADETSEPTTLYRLYNATGRLLYVGISSNVLRRLAEHSDAKPWWREATSAAFTHHETRDEALAAETAAIRGENPVYNIAGTSPCGTVRVQRADRKVGENRLRRMADRQGLRLEKSRRRDGWALDFGIYQLVDIRKNEVVVTTTDLDEVEARLTGAA